MGSLIKCVFCGQDINEELMAYRYPDDFPKFADMIYGRNMEIRGIKNVNIVLPSTCTASSPDVSKCIEQNGKKILISNMGRIIEKRICPYCHSPIYRTTEKESVNQVLFFGMPQSGRTSLVTLMIDEVVKAGFDIANDQCICILNDLCSKTMQFKDAAGRICSGEELEDIRFPVLIHRAASVNSGLEDKSDVFYDIADNDVKNEMNADMLVPFAWNAGTFVFTISVEDLLFNDTHSAQTNDMKIKQMMYMPYFLSQYSDFLPRLIIVFTKLDILYETTSSGLCLNFLRDNINDEEALKRFFKINFPISSRLSESFGYVDFKAVCCKGEDAVELMHSFYRLLIML